MRSRAVSRPAVAVAVAAIGAAATWLRWALQGSGNVYTDLSKQQYVPDPDLGWRLTDGGPIWLGLDVCAATTGLAVATLGFVLWMRRRPGGRVWAKAASIPWAAAVLALLAPIVAFASGRGPAGGRDARPAGLAAVLSDGVSGSLDAPPGRYRAIEHPGSSVVAKLRAGGEDFEARFTGGVSGTFTVDPRDLRQPLSASISVDAASVDTGIELRSKHAREDLRTDVHPRIGFELVRLVAAEPQGDGGIAFRAEGIVELVGRRHPVDFGGTLRAADVAARDRLATGSPTLLVTATLSLDLRQTAIGNDGTFDEDVIPIEISLVLTHIQSEAS